MVRRHPLACGLLADRTPGPESSAPPSPVSPSSKEDLWATWKALYTLPITPTPPVTSPLARGCFAEPGDDGPGAAQVLLADGTAVSPARACTLALGERTKLSKDRLTRVKQGKKKKPVEPAA